MKSLYFFLFFYLQNKDKRYEIQSKEDSGAEVRTMIDFSSILPATAIKLLIYSSTLLCGQFLAILSLR